MIGKLFSHGKLREETSAALEPPTIDETYEENVRRGLAREALERAELQAQLDVIHEEFRTMLPEHVWQKLETIIT